MLEEIRLVKFLIVLSFLAYATKLDLKTRIVPNKIWISLLLLTLPLNVFELDCLNLLSLVQILFIILLSYTLFRIGAFGGADAKAIISLSLIFPTYPSCHIFPVLTKSFSFSFTVLTNSVIVSPALFIYYFFKNLRKLGLEEFREKPIFYFVGFKAKVTQIPKFHNLLEIEEGGRIKKLKFGKSIEPTSDVISRIRKAGVKEVWVTPGLPFFVFITFGYLISFFVGDLILYIFWYV
ncbi:peptidase A24 [Archaeoglobales archaeon]|nr:MAG: peptidase A24 [Archaeoglobales archaeon]